MNKLIITAHPSSHGFAHRIAEKYIKGSEKMGDQVELIDLYKEERQDFLHFEDVREMPEDEIRDKMQSKIKWANELVFIFPLWWMDAPAILKNFIDNNFSAGFAYKYKKVSVLKGIPVGLLKGKTARVFITSDGSKWIYRLVQTPFRKTWSSFILKLCGIKVRSFTIFDRMRWRNDSEKERWLDEVYNIGSKK